MTGTVFFRSVFFLVSPTAVAISLWRDVRRLTVFDSSLYVFVFFRVGT
jgi:hypothetical protein